MPELAGAAFREVVIMIAYLKAWFFWTLDYIYNRQQRQLIEYQDQDDPDPDIDFEEFFSHPLYQ